MSSIRDRPSLALSRKAISFSKPMYRTTSAGITNSPSLSFAGMSSATSLAMLPVGTSTPLTTSPLSSIMPPSANIFIWSFIATPPCAYLSGAFAPPASDLLTASVTASLIDSNDLYSFSVCKALLTAVSSSTILPPHSEGMFVGLPPFNLGSVTVMLTSLITSPLSFFTAGRPSCVLKLSCGIYLILKLFQLA